MVQFSDYFLFIVILTGSILSKPKSSSHADSIFFTLNTTDIVRTKYRKVV